MPSVTAPTVCVLESVLREQAALCVYPVNLCALVFCQPACEPGHGQDRVQLGHSQGLKNPWDRGSLQHDSGAAGEDFLPTHRQDW